MFCKIRLLIFRTFPQVIYLGSMLTVMGKGEACVEKPLEVITRAWNARKANAVAAGVQSSQSQAAAGGGQALSMRLCVCRSGMRAETPMGLRNLQF